MVRLFIFTFLALLPASSFAQSKIRYTYDAAGNRIKWTAATAMQKAKSGRAVADADSQSGTDAFQDHAVKIYPNPTDGVVNISIGGLGEAEHCTLNLCTPQGTLVLEKEVKADNITLDLGDRPSGIYLLTVTIDNTPTTWKIIKRQ